MSSFAGAIGREANVTLSFKVAMLTSLMFIGGMCWLVNQVARPTVAATFPGGTPAAPMVAQTDTPISPLDRRSTSPVSAAQGLQRTAPVEHSIATAPPPKPIGEPTLTERNPLPPLGETPHGGPAVDARSSAPVTPDEPLVVARNTPRNDGGAGRTLVAQNKSEPNIFDQAKPERMPEPPAAQPEATPATRDYIVKKGDTFERIARRELSSADSATLAQLVALNPQVAKRKGHMVMLGERLTLPEAGHAGDAALTADRVAKRTTQPKDEPKTVVETTKPEPAAKSKVASKTGKTDSKTRVAKSTTRGRDSRDKAVVAKAKTPARSNTASTAGKSARHAEAGQPARAPVVARAEHANDKRESPAPTHSRKSTGKDAVAPERKGSDKIASKSTAKPGEKSKNSLGLAKMPSGSSKAVR